MNSNTFSNTSQLQRRKSSFFRSAESPQLSWTPSFDDDAADFGSESYLTKSFDMNPFTAFESLQMDDLINNDDESSSSSSGSDIHRNPSSSLHTLPAWSTTESGEEWGGPSPGNSDDAGDYINDAWFAPSTKVSRKKRSPMNKEILLAEERELSPGAANLKSCKSAPQLVKRVTSADHKSKLEDLLVEMGWPREAMSPVEAVDGGESQVMSQSYSSSHTQGGGGNDTSSYSSGHGSLASGMPVTSALFQRRAANMKDGDMPTPATVAIPGSEDVTAGIMAPVPATCVPSTNVDRKAMRQSIEQAHSRSATFPLNHDVAPSVMTRPSLVTSSSSGSLATSYNSNTFISPSQQFLSPNSTDPAVKAAQQAALYYSLGARRTSFAQQQQQLLNQSPYPGKRPDSVSSGGSMTELQTPVTPYQSLNSADIGSASSLPYNYSISPASSMSNQILQSYSTNYPVKIKTPSDMDINGTFSNSLGLHFMQPMDQSQQQQPSATMIDSSSYAQIFAGMESNMPRTGLQVPPTLKQMRSSPNIRTSPPAFDASPTRPTLRKIASNRRLTVGSSDFHNTTMSSPSKSPSKKNRSPKSAMYSNIPLPPMPTMMMNTSRSNTSSFEFVNYGIEDADELCSAVAPSGSYKVPLKGFGGSQDEFDEDDLEQEMGDMEGEKEKTLRRSRSKSNSRLGPRWQEPEAEQDDEEDNSPNENSSSSSRQIKRRKSEMNMSSNSPGRRKTASSGNLRK